MTCRACPTPDYWPGDFTCFPNHIRKDLLFQQLLMLGLTLVKDADEDHFLAPYVERHSAFAVICFDCSTPKVLLRSPWTFSCLVLDGGRRLGEILSLCRKYIAFSRSPMAHMNNASVYPYLPPPVIWSPTLQKLLVTRLQSSFECLILLVCSVSWTSRFALAF